MYAAILYIIHAQTYRFSHLVFHPNPCCIDTTPVCTLSFCFDRVEPVNIQEESGCYEAESHISMRRYSGHLSLYVASRFSRNKLVRAMRG